VVCLLRRTLLIALLYINENAKIKVLRLRDKANYSHSDGPVFLNLGCTEEVLYIITVNSLFYELILTTSGRNKTERRRI
jgi:hypothetical protein